MFRSTTLKIASNSPYRHTRRHKQVSLFCPEWRSSHKQDGKTSWITLQQILSNKLVHNLLEDRSIILITPDEDLRNRPQSLHKKWFVLLRNSQILVQYTVEEPETRNTTVLLHVSACGVCCPHLPYPHFDIISWLKFSPLLKNLIQNDFPKLSFQGSQAQQTNVAHRPWFWITKPAALLHCPLWYRTGNGWLLPLQIQRFGLFWFTCVRVCWTNGSFSLL